jgi:hypothetical protein
MPHSVEWAKKYEAKGLILIGYHSSKQETRDDVIAACKAYKLPYPNYLSLNISGVQVSGFPCFVLFDHKGKMIFKGHPMEADGKLADAMKAAPDPLVGEGPYKKLEAVAKKIIDHKDFGKILETLKTKHLNSENADEKAEAEKLVERLTKFGNRMLSKAEAKKPTEPTASFNMYNEIATLFKGDEIGDKAKAVVEELKKDKDFQENMKADKEFESIKDEVEKLKPCNKCTGGAFNKTCEGCQKKNQNYSGLVARAKALVKKYPNSPAAAKVKELVPVE